jgi:hypothetical protein
MTIGSQSGRFACIAPALVFCLGVAGCAPPRFERYVEAQRWSDAAQLFTADTTLLRNDRAVYAAANLFGTPGLSTYDPTRARDLYRRLLASFPASRYRQEASERLALLQALLRAHDDAIAQQQALETRIAQLTANTQRLRMALDSAATLADSTHRVSAKLEADLRERDDELRALRLELRQLKAIDLKPRPGRPPL